jgi:alkylation response protein AidB-like acyl-CoA dehydrogenase
MDLTLAYPCVSPQESREKTDSLSEWMRGYFARRVNSRLIDQRRCIPPYVVLDLAQRGILGFHVPTTKGGLGLRAVDWVRLLAQLGALDATISQLVAIDALAMRPLVVHGTEAQQEQWLGALARGERLASFAQTEDGAGSAFTKMESVARPGPAGEGWLLCGSKTWIGNASWSSLLIVIAKTQAASGEDLGLSAFAVPTDASGVRIGEELDTMGLRGVVQNRLFFDRVHMSKDQVIGTIGGGLKVAVDAMSFTRIVIAAQQLGLMQRCAQLMGAFAEKRSIATGLLFNNAVARNYMSECVARIDAVASLVAQCARKLDAGEALAPELSAITKMAATEFAGLVADTALQLLGGRGYEENNVVAQIVRDTRVTRIFEGPTETLASFVGARMHGNLAARVLGTMTRSEVLVDELADELAAHRRSTESLCAESGLDEAQRKQWIDFQTGGVAAWAALKLAYALNPAKLDRIADWLDGGPAPAPRYVGGVCFLDQDTLRAALRRYAQDVGDVRQSLPGINQQRDPLLDGSSPLNNSGF